MILENVNNNVGELVDSVDLFPVASSTTFFTDMHHLLKIIAVGNLRSACDHRLRFLEEVVIFRDGQYLTLKEVFKSLDLTALYELNVDLFDVHADKRILNLNNMADGLVAGSLDLLTMLLKICFSQGRELFNGNWSSMLICLEIFISILDLSFLARFTMTESEKNGRFSHKEVTVLYIPDLSDCLPSIDAWRDQWLSSKKAIAERERLQALKGEKLNQKKEAPKNKEPGTTKDLKKVDKADKKKVAGSNSKVNEKGKSGTKDKAKEAVKDDKTNAVIEKKEGAEIVGEGSNVADAETADQIRFYMEIDKFGKTMSPSSEKSFASLLITLNDCISKLEASIYAIGVVGYLSFDKLNNYRDLM
ncbi:DBC1/CARP1-like protein [Tanacetum coccineum]